MAIQLNDDIAVLADKHIDNRWGPYASIADAEAAIDASYLFNGLRVGIIAADGSVTDYWWQNGGFVVAQLPNDFADIQGQPTDNANLKTALDARATVQSVSDETTARQNADAAEATARQSGDTANANALTAHTSNVSNPHAVTLEQARSQNNQLAGVIDANNNTVKNLPNPVNGGDAVNKTYSDANLANAKAYTDSKVASPFNVAGGWDASTGNFPTAGTASDGSVRKGDMYNVTVAGIIGGVQYDIGDNIYALINAPGQTASNWEALEHNDQQATETLRGTVAIADAATVSNTASTEDTKAITAKKLWGNFWQTVLNTTWTWVVKQIYTVAPRFNSVTANQYLKVDANNDLTSIAQIPGSDVSAATTGAVGTVALSTNAQGIAGADGSTAMTPASTNAAILDNGKNFNKTVLVYNLTEIYWQPTQAGTLTALSGSSDVSNVQYKLGVSGTYAALTTSVAFAANQQIWLRWTYTNQANTFGNIYLTGKYN